ncbi:MAG: hypothetical protein JXB25_07685 [Deltaproteobacteria bacterium]|nr:hypothetical protein [Deltaproteobacteria bacterium]
MTKKMGAVSFAHHENPNSSNDEYFLVVLAFDPPGGCGALTGGRASGRKLRGP